MNALTFPLEPAGVQDGRMSFDLLMKHPEYVARLDHVVATYQDSQRGTARLSSSRSRLHGGQT
ncbi:hypothetical protein CCHOA_02800 [Corynebacterium choanae]|uniref:Uncharacterized protein n=1 Tax=Corynebacterium choanae TaxID=1862358 RepID=A0A3G6J4U1_9CORY|nr:hypothetical protein CCHOA_02800 [Corynebacterium choanae]